MATSGQADIRSHLPQPSPSPYASFPIHPKNHCNDPDGHTSTDIRNYLVIEDRTKLLYDKLEVDPDDRISNARIWIQHFRQRANAAYKARQDAQQNVQPDAQPEYSTASVEDWFATK